MAKRINPVKTGRRKFLHFQLFLLLSTEECKQISYYFEVLSMKRKMEYRVENFFFVYVIYDIYLIKVLIV